MLLMKKKEHKFIVPTYQIDLMWHTHILSSIHQYHEENMKINGMIMDHDDSLSDRSEEGELNTNFIATKKLWQATYFREYSVPGGMYEGEPPPEFFSPCWAQKRSEAVHEVAKGQSEVDWMDVYDEKAFSSTPVSEDDDNDNCVIATACPSIKGYVFGRGPRGFGCK